MANKVKEYYIVINGVKQSIAEIEKLKSALNGLTDKTIKIGIEGGDAKAISEAAKSQDELGKATKKLTEFNEEYQKSLEKTKQSLKEKNDSVKESVKAERDLQTIEEHDVSTYKKKQTLLSALGRTIRNYNAQTDDERAKLKTLVEEYERINSELKAFDKDMGNFYRNVGDYRGALQDVFGGEFLDKSKFKEQAEVVVTLANGMKVKFGDAGEAVSELKKQLAKLIAEGKEGSEEFKNLSSQLEKFLDANEATDRMVKNMKTYQGALGGVVEAMNSGIAVLQTYEGAMSLFGVNTEEASKNIERMTALMSLSKGINEIYIQTVTKGTMAYKLWNLALSGSAKLLKAVRVEQILTTAAMNSSTRATKLATLAFKGLKYAIATTGIGLLVVAVGELVGWFMSLGDSAEEAGNKMKRALDSIDTGADMKKKSIEIDVKMGNMSEYEAALEKIYDMQRRAQATLTNNFSSQFLKSLKLITELIKEPGEMKMITKEQQDIANTVVKLFEHLNSMDFKNIQNLDPKNYEEFVRVIDEALAKLGLNNSMIVKSLEDFDNVMKKVDYPDIYKKQLKDIATVALQYKKYLEEMRDADVEFKKSHEDAMKSMYNELYKQAAQHEWRNWEDVRNAIVKERDEKLKLVKGDKEQEAIIRQVYDNKILEAEKSFNREMKNYSLRAQQAIADAMADSYQKELRNLQIAEQRELMQERLTEEEKLAIQKKYDRLYLNLKNTWDKKKADAEYEYIRNLQNARHNANEAALAETESYYSKMLAMRKKYTDDYGFHDEVISNDINPSTGTKQYQAAKQVNGNKDDINVILDNKIAEYSEVYNNYLNAIEEWKNLNDKLNDATSELSDDEKDSMSRRIEELKPMVDEYAKMLKKLRNEAKDIINFETHNSDRPSWQRNEFSNVTTEFDNDSDAINIANNTKAVFDKLKEIRTKYWSDNIKNDLQAQAQLQRDTIAYHQTMLATEEQTSKTIYEAKRKLIIEKKKMELSELEKTYNDEEKLLQENLDNQIISQEEYNTRSQQLWDTYNDNYISILQKSQADINSLEEDFFTTGQNKRREFYATYADIVNVSLTSVQNLWDDALQNIQNEINKPFNFKNISTMLNKEHDASIKALNEIVQDIGTKLTEIQQQFDLFQATKGKEGLNFNDFSKAKGELLSLLIAVQQTIRQINSESKEQGKEISLTWADWVNNVGNTVSQAMQSIFSMMNTNLQYEIDNIQNEIDKTEEMLQAQEDMTQKHADKVNSIESELANARGERRQHLIDALNKEKAAQESSYAKEQALEQKKKAQEAKKRTEEEKLRKQQHKQQLAQAIVSGALAITNGFATQPFVPLGIAMGALATTLTAIQIATIANTKYANGGLLNGASHANGGIPVGNTGIEVEGNEFITNKATTMQNLELMNFINSKKRRLDVNDFIEFYSSPININTSGLQNSRKYANGGQLSSLQPLEYNNNIKEIIIRDETPIVVSVEQITRQQNNVRNVQVLAGIS